MGLLQQGFGQPEPRGKQSAQHNGQSKHPVCYNSCRRMTVDDCTLRTSTSARLSDHTMSNKRDKAYKAIGHIGVKEQKIRMARQQFMKSWGTKTKAIGDWNKLGTYTYITTNQSYEPYEELDDLIGRIWEIGRAGVQVQLPKSVIAWIHDHSIYPEAIEVPIHLKSVQGIEDSKLLQDLYLSMEVADQKCRCKSLFLFFSDPASCSACVIQALTRHSISHWIT